MVEQQSLESAVLIATHYLTKPVEKIGILKISLGR